VYKATSPQATKIPMKRKRRIITPKGGGVKAVTDDEGEAEKEKEEENSDNIRNIIEGTVPTITAKQITI
jgi:hypothetical protein